MELFKKYRKELNLSQKQIAKILDTNQGIISKIERGELYGRYFVAYLRFLAEKGIDVNRFFLGEPPQRNYK